jgi:hypothetical protein
VHPEYSYDHAARQGSRTDDRYARIGSEHIGVSGSANAGWIAGSSAQISVRQRCVAGDADPADTLWVTLP